MTRKGTLALRRFARAQGWSETRVAGEIQHIDREVNSFMAHDPYVRESDRFWLEMAVRAPESAPLLMAINYPGPFGTIQ